jgi:UDP-N-acetylglucosamine acyltransferase
MGIDSSSIISNSAKIHSSVDIGPFCIIGDDVELGEGTSVLSHAIIKGPTKIGKK